MNNKKGAMQLSLDRDGVLQPPLFIFLWNVALLGLRDCFLFSNFYNRIDTNL